MAKKPVKDKEPIMWDCLDWSYRETDMGSASYRPPWWAFCMEKLIIFAVAIFIIGLIFEFFRKSTPKHSVQFVARDGYRKKDFVMNKSESAFLFELQRQIPKDYFIFPKMRIADMIDATDG